MTPEGGAGLGRHLQQAASRLHGVIMVFFFLVPVVPAVLGNFCLPLMIGAKDLAFPRLNLLSWYLYHARRGVDAVRHARRRRRYRLDVLHALQLAVVALQRRADDDRHRDRRLLVDVDGAQLHRHDRIGCARRA